MDSDIRKLPVLARKLTEISAAIDRETDEVVRLAGMNVGVESTMSLSEAILELRAVARGFRELGELMESANEHSISLSPERLFRELHNQNAKLRSTLVRWEEAEADVWNGDDEGE